MWSVVFKSKHMKQFSLTLLILLFSVFSANAQNTKIDSLENLLKKSTLKDKTRLDVLNKLIWDYSCYDSAKTVRCLNQMVPLAEKLNNHFTKSMAYNSYAWLLLDSGHFDEAQKMFETTLSIGVKHNLNKSKIRAYQGLGYVESDRGNYPEAIEYFNKLLEIAKSSNNNRGTITAYQGFSNTYRLMGKNQKALEYIKFQLEIYKKEDNKSSIYESYNNMGLIYHELGNYNKSLECYHLALKHTNLPINSKLYYIYNNMGRVYTEQKEWDKALEFLNKSLNTARKQKDMRVTANSLNNIGEIYNYQKKYKKAILKFKEALEIRKQTGEKFGIAYSYKHIGKTYIELQDFEEALVNLNKSHDLYKKINDQRGICSTLNLIGSVYIQKKQYAKAIQNLNLSAKIAIKIKQANIIRDANKNLSIVYNKTGNYKLAFKSLQQYKLMADSLHNSENTKRITQQSMQYDFDREKEALAAEQAKKDALQLSEMKRQKQLRNSFIGSAIIFFILSIIILRSLIQKRKTNSLLAEKNEKITAQTEELKSKNASLIELSDFKEDMTNMVVHDLKNPISSIMNIDLIPDEERRTNTIKHAGNKMMHLVQNILDVYKYKMVKMELQEANFDLQELINKAIEEIHFIAEQKHLEFSIDINQKIEIIADKDIIRRVLINILSNAVKFAPEASKISISATVSESDKLKLSVHNQGKHIPKEQQQYIFNKFGQSEKRSQGKFKSTGLGLTFCLLAIQAHNGNIGVDSKENQGATFWFTLPKAKIDDTNTQTNTEIINTEETVSLSESEKKELKHYLPQLEKITVVEISSFLEIFTEIKGKNLGNNSWNTSLENAAYSCDQKQYDSLIKMIKE